MEKVYSPSNYNCSEPTDWNEHLIEYEEAIGKKILLSADDTTKKESQKLKTLAESVDLDLDIEDLQNLEVSCNIHLLDVPGEVTKEDLQYPLRRGDIMKRSEDNFPENSLETVKVKKKWMNTTDLGIRRKFDTDPILPPVSGEDPDLIPGEDLVITVKVYVPFPFHSKENVCDRARVNYELVVLGSQTLEQLKDKIFCPNTNTVYREIHTFEELQAIRQLNAKDEYPASFFLMDNTFYYDKIDTTEELRKWAKQKEIADFNSLSMNEKKLCDIKFRLGYPYVFQHVADCEHLIVFSDVKLLTKKDLLSSKDYPYLLKVHRLQKVKCCICGIDNVRVLVTDSDRLPERVGHFCDDCFKSYNFIDGKKVGVFKAFPYQQPLL